MPQPTSATDRLPAAPRRGSPGACRSLSARCHRVRPLRWTYGGTAAVLPEEPVFPSAARHNSWPCSDCRRPAAVGTLSSSHNSETARSRGVIMVPRDPALRSRPPAFGRTGCRSLAPAARTCGLAVRRRVNFPASRLPGRGRPRRRSIGAGSVPAQAGHHSPARTAAPQPGAVALRAVRPPRRCGGRGLPRDDDHPRSGDRRQRSDLRRRPLAVAAAGRHRRRPVVGRLGRAEAPLGAVPADVQRLPNHHLGGRSVLPRGSGRSRTRPRHLARPGPRPGHRRARRGRHRGAAQAARSQRPPAARDHVQARGQALGAGRRHPRRARRDPRADRLRHALDRRPAREPCRCPSPTPRSAG